MDYEARHAMPQSLTIPKLQSEATAFARVESAYPEPTLYGVTDGKAVGTYLEHKFQAHLKVSYDFALGNSATGIDLPRIGGGHQSHEHPPASILLPLQERQPENLRPGLLPAHLRLG